MGWLTGAGRDSARRPLHGLMLAAGLAAFAVVAMAFTARAAAIDDEAAAAQPDLAGLMQPGPYQIERREVTVPRPGEDEGGFAARLYIPLAPDGAADGPQAPAAAALAFGHGYLAPVELYESTLAHLASWGIATIAPRSGGELFPDHAAFGDDLSTAVDWLASTATRPDWPGPVVDPAARGLGGHSMGGGSAVLAAADDPSIAAVATLAAADTRPSSIEAAARLTVPALFVAAAADAITPVGTHQRPMFEAVTAAPAQLRTIDGGSHCGFLDRAVLAGLVCDRGALDEAAQLRLSQALLTAWLRYQLLGDDTMVAAAWPREPRDGTTLETNGR